jgi:hypothetical protein
MPFPAPPGTYPGKEQVATYLEDYARAFDLPVNLGARVGFDQPGFLTARGGFSHTFSLTVTRVRGWTT